MPDITKLPKWAQAHIEKVERERDNAERELATLKEGSLENIERQKFYVDSFAGDPFWLPQYGRLAFKQDPESEASIPDFTIRESDNDLGGIEVSCSANGRLAILPKASNVVQLSILPYR